MPPNSEPANSGQVRVETVVKAKYLIWTLYAHYSLVVSKKTREFIPSRQVLENPMVEKHKLTLL
ncbi:hypothetical protein [Rhodohalobacter halophilus]|uniref:hypothetical protein n=1 Tax=Rhodohalobacter halophilus TaxID=1812810 RepID=UPI00083F6AD7|nr:hypothetical protein [Rhodohalobacter halophilus]